MVTRKSLYLPFLLLIITLLTLSPSLRNGFVNMDDPGYILNNSVIKNFTTTSFKTIFTKQFMGNYHPFTMLSYLVEYKLWGPNPYVYHLTNLIFHLLSTLLVFYIFKKISKNQYIAFITALLFGIHPLHVESVVWISETKDVLYGFFFLASLYLYASSPGSGSKTKPAYGFRYFTILLLFLCSLLSKAQAVILPLIFFLIDYIEGRKLSKRNFLEKIPFFVIALIFGLIAIKAQGKTGAVQPFEYFPFYERILFACYALVCYMYKLILPVNLSCFYPYPETGDKINTVFVYLSPVIILGIIFCIWKFFRESKIVLFGILLFLLPVLLILQLIPIGDALYADRYMYIPSLGLFFIAGNYLGNRLKNKFTLVLFSLYTLWLCVLSFQQSKVWHDSISLYSNAIGNGYKYCFIYGNRSAAFSEKNNWVAALADADSALRYVPYHPNTSTLGDLWRNKALSQEQLGQKEEAIKSYTQAVECAPENISNYLKRGIMYEGVKDFSAAISDFSKAVQLSPNSGEGYFARAEALCRIGKLQEALTDISTGLQFSPDRIQEYNNRGIIYSMSGKYQEAVNDFTKSIELNPDYLSAYTNRAFVYKKIGKYTEALQDLLIAKGKGKQVNERMLNDLINLTSGRANPS